MGAEVPSADLFKATSSLILFSIALIGGILPQRLQNVGSKVVSCLNTAAGGVFFASAMVGVKRIWRVEAETQQCRVVGSACGLVCGVEFWGLCAPKHVLFLRRSELHHHVSLMCRQIPV